MAGTRKYYMQCLQPVLLVMRVPGHGDRIAGINGQILSTYIFWFSPFEAGLWHTSREVRNPLRGLCHPEFYSPDGC